MEHVKRLANEDGATTVEYGILVATMLVVVIAAGPYLWKAMISLMGFILDDMIG